MCVIICLDHIHAAINIDVIVLLSHLLFSVFMLWLEYRWVCSLQKVDSSDFEGLGCLKEPM